MTPRVSALRCSHSGRSAGVSGMHARILPAFFFRGASAAAIAPDPASYVIGIIADALLGISSLAEQ